jgi:hypothetical protein
MAGPGSKKTQFKKGESGNPAGKPPLDPKIKELKKLTAVELEEMINGLLSANEEELNNIDASASEPYIRRIMVRILQRTYETGSMQQLDMILNRLIGKVKEHIQHTIVQPKILVRRDGSEIVFAQKPAKKIDEEKE